MVKMVVKSLSQKKKKKKSDSTKTDYKTYGEMVEGQDNPTPLIILHWQNCAKAQTALRKGIDNLPKDPDVVAKMQTLAEEVLQLLETSLDQQ